MKSLIFALAPFLAVRLRQRNQQQLVPDMAMVPTTLGTAPTLAIALRRPGGRRLHAADGPAGDGHDPSRRRLPLRGDRVADGGQGQLADRRLHRQRRHHDTVPSRRNATSGFWTYRVAYRTLRDDAQGRRHARRRRHRRRSCSSPKSRSPARRWSCSRTARSASRPSARRRCSTSRGAIKDQDYPVSIYTLAGYGYTVIAPDYSGFSYGQPPGYFNAEDEAHSVLDATRAAANLLPSPPDKVVFVGHSQGGHAALSAQSLRQERTACTARSSASPRWRRSGPSMALWAAGTTDVAGS